MSFHSLVLVVDDQPYGRQALASLLEADGYRFAFASGGPEALAQTARLRPDLVLLDVMMPDMDGYEVCRRLRADPRSAEVPIIMVTALDDPDSLLQGIGAGADDFVTKPFNRAELRARIRTITRLNRYRNLWENRDRYERLVEHSPNGVLVIDGERSVRLANPGLLRLLNIELASVKDHDALQIFAPDRRAEVASRLAALAAGAEEFIHLETTLVGRDGVRRPVELDGGRCEWDTGPALQLLVRDITDRKRAELLDVERRHIAYELHDGVAQLVAGLYQHLQLFARRHRLRSPAAIGGMEQLQAMARQTVRETRRVLEGLRPSALDDFGLAGALGMLVESLRSEGWAISYDSRLADRRLPASTETALFRIAQEALMNTRKYAGELRAGILIESDGSAARLAVRDWGPGFDLSTLLGPSGVGERLGLRAMRERAELLGGELRIETGPGLGVLIVATIPVGQLSPEGTSDEC